MKLIFLQALSIFLSLLPASLLAQTETLRYEYKNWLLICDSTHTCRASSSELSKSNPLELVLTRPAGPNTLISAQLIYNGSHTDRLLYLTLLNGHFLLQIDENNLGTLDDGNSEVIANLTESQVNYLINNTRNILNIVAYTNDSKISYSGAGLTAVMLKMDEYQRRVKTPGAVVKKGDVAERTVLPATPLPEIIFKKYITNKECFGHVNFFDDIEYLYRKNIKSSCAKRIINDLDIEIQVYLIPTIFIEDDPLIAYYDLHLFILNNTNKEIISRSLWKDWLKTDYSRLIKRITIDELNKTNIYPSEILSLTLDFSMMSLGYGSFSESERSLFKIDHNTHAQLLKNYNIRREYSTKHDGAYEFWYKDFRWESFSLVTNTLDVIEIYEMGVLDNMEENETRWVIKNNEKILRRLIYSNGKFTIDNNEPKSPECKLVC